MDPILLPSEPTTCPPAVVSAERFSVLIMWFSFLLLVLCCLRTNLEAVPRRTGLSGADLLGLAGLQYPADDAGEQSEEQFLHGTGPLFGGAGVWLSALTVYGWRSAPRTSLYGSSR